MKNRFKGLDPIDKVPDELWTEVSDIVQETGTKTIPMEKKCKKGNGCLRRPYKSLWREAKSKGEKERYSHLNAEFQRIARRDKKIKAFLSDQCKQIEENNRLGKTRDLFKKVRGTKGTFHAKMGLLKNRDGIDLIEAEVIKKRQQEYTEELYRKDLHDPDNHYSVITHLESDILEYEVKSALESITTNKASGCDEILVELFSNPERWCCENAALNMPANLENSAVATGLEKSSFHSNPKESQCKECLNYHTITLISHASKVMLKILQVRL